MHEKQYKKEKVTTRIKILLKFENNSSNTENMTFGLKLM